MTKRRRRNDDHYGLTAEGYALAATLADLPPAERIAELERVSGPLREPEVMISMLLSAHQARLDGLDLVIEV